MALAGPGSRAQPLGAENLPPAQPLAADFICDADDGLQIYWQALEKDFGELTGTLRFRKLRHSKVSVPAALLQLRSADAQNYIGIELAKYFSDIDDIGISLHRQDEKGEKVMIPTGMAAREGDAVPFAMAWKRDEWLGIRIHKEKGWRHGALNFTASSLYLSCAAAAVEFFEVSVKEFERIPQRWREGFDAPQEEQEEAQPDREPEEEFRLDEPVISPTVTGMARLHP